MDGWVVFLIVLPIFLAVIILIVFRNYYRTHSKEKEKEKIPSDPLENADEIKRKETFRQMLKNFLERY
ncbi:MAG: hypothetical protein ACTSVO_14825 [Candidatus Heimdallarchaeaceae archaeon]